MDTTAHWTDVTLRAVRRGAPADVARPRTAPADVARPRGATGPLRDGALPDGGAR